MADPNKTPKKQPNCITKCYRKGTIIHHPITNEQFSSYESSFCAILPLEIDGKKVISRPCETKQSDDDGHFGVALDEITKVVPTMEMSDITFLSVYYNINNLNDLHEWLRAHKNIPLLTKERFLNCYISGYVSDVTIIDEVIIELVMTMIKKLWIFELYRSLRQYITIIDKKPTVVDPSQNKLSKNENKEIRINYLFSEITTPKNITSITYTFIEYVQARKSANITAAYYQHYLNEHLEIILQNIVKDNTKKD